jgi:hypothetical protein
MAQDMCHLRESDERQNLVEQLTFIRYALGDITDETSSLLAKPYYGKTKNEDDQHMSNTIITTRKKTGKPGIRSTMHSQNTC